MISGPPARARLRCAALAETFDFPLNKIRVVSKAVGGGFGCKAGTTLEGIVIPLAMLNPGRPVKLTYTREDEFQNALCAAGLHQHQDRR
ncbi:MAG: molybdopterin cofactor-binding domain-containing protein [Eubacteriales bacterium]